MTNKYRAGDLLRRSGLIVILLSFFCSNTIADAGFDLEELRGKVVMLDFWASWCVPCRDSFPWMNNMQQKYADEGLVIIGVNVDADADAAQKFLEKYPAPFRLISDPDGVLAQEYGVIVMPSTFVFDRDGELAATHRGFKVRRQDEYETVLIDALQKQ